MKHRILLAVALVFFIGLGATNLVHAKQTIRLKNLELKDTTLRLQQLEQKYDFELKQKNVNQEELKKLQEEKAKLEQELQARVEAKRIAAVRLQEAAQAALGAKPVYAATLSRTGDTALDSIIQHESGWNPYATNSIGACGLGQSLPCSKVLNACGSLANVACQIQWVRDYCISRYGSTASAWAFWQLYRWY